MFWCHLVVQNRECKFYDGFMINRIKTTERLQKVCPHMRFGRAFPKIMSLKCRFSRNFPVNYDFCHVILLQKIFVMIFRKSIQKYIGQYPFCPGSVTLKNRGFCTCPSLPMTKWDTLMCDPHIVSFLVFA